MCFSLTNHCGSFVGKVDRRKQTMDAARLVGWRVRRNTKAISFVHTDSYTRVLIKDDMVALTVENFLRVSTLLSLFASFAFG